VLDLTGTSSLVTGGASGLGEATVRALAARGAAVVVVDLQDEKGQAVAKSVGGGYVRADVTDSEQVIAAIAAAEEHGPLRTLVTAAGIGWAARTIGRDGSYDSAHDLGIFQKVLAVNLVGTFNCIRLAATAMSRHDAVDADGLKGAIVTMASVAAFDGQIGQIAYSASKGGIVGMTLPAARDLAQYGIRVMTIAPGLFDTPLLAMLPDDAREALGNSIPFPQRLGLPEEYAQLATSIVENPMLNGEVIRLDGALRMAPR
jgi:NAD(P)-dependent dehydrogenase (short-subunit alcohol dehydrogenase family)